MASPNKQSPREPSVKERQAEKGEITQSISMTDDAGGKSTSDQALRKEFKEKLTLVSKPEGTKKAQLGRDVLRVITKTVMFARAKDIPEWQLTVDLRDFHKLNLLFASRLARNAMLLQFRRLSKLYFNADDGSVNLFEPVNLEALDEMVVFKDFLITGWMFFWMLSTDVLRLKHISIVDDEYDRAAPMRHDEKPAESLVKLILFKDSPVNRIRADKYDLSNVEMELESVEQSSSPPLIGSFDRVLNLNARHLEISFTGFYENDFFPSTPSRIIAKRTEDFRLLYYTHNHDGVLAAMEDFEYWYEQLLMQYIKECCPNLKVTIFDVLNVV